MRNNTILRRTISKCVPPLLCLWICTLIFSAGIIHGLDHAVLAQGSSSSRRQPLTNRTGIAKPAKSDLTFSRIDRIGDKCAMVYGSLSFGGDDFLIQDCGGSSLKWKWTGRLGYINKMFFQNEETGWFAVSGALLKVKGEGVGFDATVVRKDKHERINDVFFINKRLGWICGTDGAILNTEDGGQTWNRKESHTDITLKEIRFLNAWEGWVSGSDYINGKTVNLTLLTKDGGRSWVPLNEDKGLNLSPVFFTSSRQGCGIDEEGAIVCTSDGDKWRVTYSDKGAHKNKNSIFFLNEKQGWIVGDGIWHTENGGQTWTQQLELPAKSTLVFQNVIFVNERLGWAQTLTGVWRTSDGGTSWTKISDTWIEGLG